MIFILLEFTYIWDRNGINENSILFVELFMLFFFALFLPSVVLSMSTGQRPSSLTIYGASGVLGRRLLHDLITSDPSSGGLPYKEIRGYTSSSMRSHGALSQQILEWCPGSEVKRSVGCTKIETPGVVVTLLPYAREVDGDCVFTLPPSAFPESYTAELAEVASNVKGVFLHTSSGGVYNPEGTITETTPCPGGSLRQDKMLAAEAAVLSEGGVVARLAGLYTVSRGAHMYFLQQPEVPGDPESTVNLVHYFDVSSAIVEFLKGGPDLAKKIRERTNGILLISDSLNPPITRRGILEAAHKSPRLASYLTQTGGDVTLVDNRPPFTGGAQRRGGGTKVYDCSATKELLREWQCQYSSFADFMTKVDEEEFAEDMYDRVFQSHS